MNILDVRNLKKIYGGMGRVKTEALKDVNFSVEKVGNSKERLKNGKYDFFYKRKYINRKYVT